MANKNTSTAVATVNEQNVVTEQLLNDYLNTITDKLTNPQRAQFIAVATAFGLNPFKREIYATTYRNKDGGTNMSIVTGYEVYLKRAEMNPNYDGYETEFGLVNSLINCTCRVYRKDRSKPVTSCVWMNEYNTGKSLWSTKPKMMLEKVAIATAFRRAFPTDFGDMPYTTDELPETMTWAARLEQQGYTEAVPEPQETTSEPANDPKDTKAPTPLSEPRRAKFYEFIASETKRVGKAAFDRLLLNYGGLEGLLADSERSVEFAKECKKLPDYVEAEVTEEDVPF